MREHILHTSFRFLHFFLLLLLAGCHERSQAQEGGRENENENDEGKDDSFHGNYDPETSTTEYWRFPDSFFFGLATAPAHVEDGLDDMWLQFAEEGNIPAWHNQTHQGASHPGERLRFFSNPDPELDLVEESGVQVLRVGVDWGRLVPDPNQCTPSALQTKKDFQAESCELDAEALAGYDAIIANARRRGLRIMMTLFHHSAPQWAADLGGWTSPDVRNKFVGFGHAVMDHFSDDVEFWNTFNEPAVYAMLTYVAGIWPPGTGTDATGMIPIVGAYDRSIENMGAAHNALYELARRPGDDATPYGLRRLNLRSQIGVAHNVSYHKADGPLALAQAVYMRQKQNYQFIDLIVDQLDFLGLNYYGAEYIRGVGLALRQDREYSDSGRAVEPYGLYALLMDFHERYNNNPSSLRNLPIIITENGVSDSTDYVRPAYLVEHLLAIHKAMEEGVPVAGYIFWTISDNWEWADGYCPQFGLYHVDRSDPDLRRSKTPVSADLFREIVRTRMITRTQRNESWRRLMLFAVNGGQREMCRASDGQGSLDTPEPRPASSVDWQFSGRPLDPPLPEENNVSGVVASIMEDNPLLSLNKLREIAGDVRVQQVTVGEKRAVEITLEHRIVCDLTKPFFSIRQMNIGERDTNTVRIYLPEEEEMTPERSWRAEVEGIFVRGYTALSRVDIASINYQPPEDPLQINPMADDILTVKLAVCDRVISERSVGLFGEPAVENCRRVYGSRRQIQ